MTDHFETTIIVWYVVATVAIVALSWIAYSAVKDIQGKCSLLYPLLGTFAGLSLFLWWPWLCYAVSQAYTWNTGKINQLERAPIVVPMDPPVIDLREQR